MPVDPTAQVFTSGKTKRPEYRVKLPDELSFKRNCGPSLRALSFVRDAAQQKLLLRYLDFDGLRYVSPAAALMMASEIDQWNRTSQGLLSARDANWDPNVRKLLCEMGLFDLLKLDRPVDLEGTTSTRFLPFIRGEVDANRANAGARAKELNKMIQDAAGQEIKRHLLFTGISEAITNVSHHAYRSGTKARPWWMFAAYDSASCEVTVVFLDHGLTIPGTLPAWKGIEKLKVRFGGWKDGQKIHAAMELGRSGTSSIGRGKGLPDLLTIVKAHPGSSLRIFSRRGLLTVENMPRGSLSFRSSSLARSLKGTLIEWKFVPKNLLT